MNTNFKRNLLVGFGISLVILLISSGASYMSIRNLLGSNRWVNHTQEVIYNVNRGSRVMLDAQTSMRGFLITGKRSYLTRYNNSEQRAEAYFDKVGTLTKDNPVQQQNIKELMPEEQKFFDYMKEMIASREAGNPVDNEKLKWGEDQMEKIRSLLSKMEQSEQELLDERTSNTGKYANYSVTLIVIAAIVALLISISFFMRILNDYNERARLHKKLQDKDIETAKRIKIISNVATQISAGNFAVRVDEEAGDELGSVSSSLNNMANALGTSFRAISEKEWMQRGLAELNEVMIGEKTIRLLTEDILGFLCNYTDSSAGIFYISHDDALQFSAGYSYLPIEGKDRLELGEGLAGQAAVSGKLLELKNISQDEIAVNYALGVIKPRHIVALPFISGTLEGVAVLASVSDFTPLQIDFLNSVSDNIGISIKAGLNRLRVQELLEETQAQAEELKVQHTELESMNVELEAQTEKLQVSEEELKVQQEELQQTNEELAERSVLLEERNLEIQKKSEDLERTTRYKSEFLANMSHELRTPLNSILLLSRLLSENNEKNLSGEQIEFAKVIQSSGNGLLGLIDEILDLSKIEAGKMDLELRETAITDIAYSMKNLFTEVAKEKNIAFEVIEDKAPLIIRTDRMRLEQIIKNLVSNAIKFTSEGKVTLEITKAADNKVAFTVRDTGIGIPTEKQAFIFEAFQQADGSTKRKYGGTGLGLSISRELARLLNGEIKLESKVGQGSAFTLTIPVLGTEAPASSLAEIMPAEVAGLPPSQNKPDPYISPTIPEDVEDDRQSIVVGDKVMLIVEDDVSFAKALLEFTRNKGYKGVVTVRGDYALNMALTYHPAGILLDVQLPIKSGLQVMDELKANTLTKHIPVHIMSSHHLKKESMLRGAVNFLDKPVAFEQMPEIFRKIEHIVNRESQKVLIVEDNTRHAQALSYFLESNNITSEIKSDIAEGVSALKSNDVDCVILDMGIPGRQGYELLESIRKNPGLEDLPVIIFTGKSLSLQEEVKIKKYADSIVVKTAHSYQRMLDEVSLFLHIVEGNKNRKEGVKNQRIHNDVLRNKKVLLVDDDVRNIYSLTKALEAMQMEVITAIDGKEALDMLKSHPDTDVVLLDMMMPNMDGYETATMIRKDNKFSTLPVIAVTAKAMTGDREKCINAGASDYITKPVDVDQLLSLLRVWLFDKA